MEKSECIKQILSDEDIVRRVKEWISGWEDVQQASLAASIYNSMDLKVFLNTLPANEFHQMIQDLDIEKASTSRSHPSSKRNPGALASNPDQDVPIELDDDDDTTSTEPEIKASDITSARAENISSAPLKSTIFDDKENVKLKTKGPTMATTQNFPRAPEREAQGRHQRNKCNYSEDEANVLHPALPQGNTAPTEISVSTRDSQASDSSSLESFRAEETGSNQDFLEFESIPRSTSSMSDGSAEHNSSPSTDHEEPASDGLATEHASALPGEDDLQQSNRPSVSNYQLPHGPEHDNHGDDREFRSPGQNPQQLPLTEGLQSAPQAVGQLQNLIPPQINLQNPSQIQLETLHACVMMLNRELIRRGIQPIRCDSCTNLQAEIGKLRSSCRCLGQQLELLKWNYILLEEVIKNLEEALRQKENENKESIQIIQYFHKKLVERKNEITKLKKEKDVMQNKFEEEFIKQLYERADKEEQNQSEVYEQMKKQTEMLETVNKSVSADRHEKQVLQAELKQKSEESSDLQKENQSLQKENKELKDKLETSETITKQLVLRIQTLEEEKRREREANQALQDDYICREAQFNDRINSEIKQLKELFEDLQTIAQRHGFFNSLAGLNFERENHSTSAPP